MQRCLNDDKKQKYKKEKISTFDDSHINRHIVYMVLS